MRDDQHHGFQCQFLMIWGQPHFGKPPYTDCSLHYGGTDAVHTTRLLRKKTTTRATSSLRPLIAHPTLIPLSLLWMKPSICAGGNSSVFVVHVLTEKEGYMGSSFLLLLLPYSNTVIDMSSSMQKSFPGKTHVLFPYIFCLIVVYVAGCRPGIWSILMVSHDKSKDKPDNNDDNKPNCTRKP